MANGFCRNMQMWIQMEVPLGGQPIIHLNQSNKNRTTEFPRAELIMSHITDDYLIPMKVCRSCDQNK